MKKYVLQHTLMKTGMTFKQSDIDQLLTLKESTAKVQEMEFEKGIQRKTLELVQTCLKKHRGEFLSSEQISSETALSKVTIRRYMNYLIEKNKAVSRIDYSTGGRPCVEYCMMSESDKSEKNVRK